MSKKYKPPQYKSTFVRLVADGCVLVERIVPLGCDVKQATCDMIDELGSLNDGDTITITEDYPK